MASQEQVRESLKKVMVPVVMRDIEGLNLVKQITTSGDEVKITLASTALNDEAKEWVSNKAKEAVGKLSGVKKVAIEFSEATPVELNKIGSIIAVMSGKGGVGKSLVAGLTAIALKRQGYEVGILDADLTGPSIPKMFGIASRPSGSETGILPVLARCCCPRRTTPLSGGGP
jgi:ATP-binding protein involved in chromosome partitioning